MKSPRILLCVLLLVFTCCLRWPALADDDKPDAGPQPSAEEQKAYDELAKRGVLAEAIAQNVNWRYANFRGAEKPDAAVFALLKPCQLLVDLDLGGAPVTDDDLANLEGLTNLKRLNLARCQKITDAGLAHLKGLAHLEWLNLFETNVTDAGLANLNGLKNLKRLYVFESKVTDAGAKVLEQAVSGLKVDQGWKVAPATPKPEEKPVALAATATQPATPAPPARPAPQPEEKKPEPKPATPAAPAAPAALLPRSPLPLRPLPRRPHHPRRRMPVPDPRPRRRK
jgi:hypothetical protein